MQGSKLEGDDWCLGLEGEGWKESTERSRCWKGRSGRLKGWIVSRVFSTLRSLEEFKGNSTTLVNIGSHLAVMNETHVVPDLSPTNSASP